MLTPEDFEKIAKQAEKIYSELELEIIKEIADGIPVQIGKKYNIKKIGAYKMRINVNVFESFIILLNIIIIRTKVNLLRVLLKCFKIVDKFNF